MQKLADGLAKPRGEKRLAKLHERLGRLKAKSRGASQHYTIELVPDAAGKKATALHFSPRPIDGSRLTHPGVYCLQSNETGWEAEPMWRTYSMLTDLEAVFRRLKPELGRRPVFHHQEQRGDGHLFITVLAYQCVQLIRRWRKHGIDARWSTLRETLASPCRVTATFQRADGRTRHVRKATRPEPEALAMYQALNLNPAPGGFVKMIDRVSPFRSHRVSAAEPRGLQHSLAHSQRGSTQTSQNHLLFGKWDPDFDRKMHKILIAYQDDSLSGCASGGTSGLREYDQRGGEPGIQTAGLNGPGLATGARSGTDRQSG